MRGVRSIVAVMTVNVAVIAGSSAAQGDPLPPPGGQLIIVAAAEEDAAVTIDGSSAGHLGWATVMAPQRLAAGSHVVRVGAAGGEVIIGSGCAVLVVAGRPAGPTAAPSLTIASECPLAGPAPGAATVRFLPVVPVATGPLGFQAGDSRLDAVMPGTATRRAEVPAGELAWTVTREGEVIRSSRQKVEADTAMTAVFAGGGERTPTLIWVTEGARQPDQMKRTTTAHTGEGPLVVTGRPRQTVAGLVLGLLAIVVVAAVRSGLGRPAPGPVALVAVTALLAVGCQTGPASQTTSGDRSRPEDTSSAGGADRPGPTPEQSPPGASQRVLPASVEFRAGVAEDGRPRTVHARIVPFDAEAIAGLPRSLRNPLVGWVTASGGIGNGMMVLLGHGPLRVGYGVFSDIASLRVGDRIQVIGLNGEVATYVVEGGVQTPKGRMWEAIDAPTATPLLALVTCAGDIVGDLHADNLTVIAHRSA